MSEKHTNEPNPSERKQNQNARIMGYAELQNDDDKMKWCRCIRVAHHEQTKPVRQGRKEETL
jgi:hypothetical protein